MNSIHKGVMARLKSHWWCNG